MTCKLCSAASHLKFNIKGYIQHLRLFHAHLPDFKTVCSIHGCLRSFTNFGTFLNHVYSVHGENSRASCTVIPENNSALAESHEDEDESCEDEDDNHYAEQDFECNNGQPTNDLDNQPCFSREMLQKSSATFLLGIKEKFKLTQASLQGIIQGVTALNHQNMSALKGQVCMRFSNVLAILSRLYFQIYDILNARNISPMQVPALQECFKQYESPFIGLETHYQQV